MAARAIADVVAVIAVAVVSLYALWESVQSALADDTLLFALWLAVAMCGRYTLTYLTREAPAT